jgi:hypothetical protein
MDATQNDYLGQLTNSSKLFFGVLITFMVIILILIILNPKGFSKYLGYEILVTIPLIVTTSILIREIILLAKYPQDSIFYSFSLRNQWLFIALVLLTVALMVGGIYFILHIAGIFSDNPPENNIQMLINLFIIMFFLSLAFALYLKSRTNANAEFMKMSKAAQELYTLRNKYISFFIILCLVITALYLYNPYGFMTDYGGPVIFLSLFVGMVLVAMISIYQLYLSKPDVSSGAEVPSFLSYIVRGGYILTALTIAILLIYFVLKSIGMFNQDASQPNTWGHFLFNFVLFMGLLGIVYKLANAGGFLDKNPYYRLFLNTIFYIPCLLVYIINYGITLGSNTPGLFEKPKPFEIKMLLLSLGLLIGYFFIKYYLVTRYLKQGGTQLINNPVSTDKLTNIGDYETFSVNNKYNYQYAISFWTYLDAFPPNSKAELAPILSYDSNPCVKYSKSDNTLYVTVKNTEDKFDTRKHITSTVDADESNWTNISKNIGKNISNSIENVKQLKFPKDIDSDGDRIIYKQPDVKLQKWNNMVLNYNGGTLDIFYNGKLVKSAIEVVPYVNTSILTIGSENGVNGNISNVMYFNQPLDVLTVNTLYSSLKGKSPPTI